MIMLAPCSQPQLHLLWGRLLPFTHRQKLSTFDRVSKKRCQTQKGAVQVTHAEALNEPLPAKNSHSLSTKSASYFTSLQRLQGSANAPAFCFASLFCIKMQSCHLLKHINLHDMLWLLEFLSVSLDHTITENAIANKIQIRPNNLICTWFR